MLPMNKRGQVEWLIGGFVLVLIVVFISSGYLGRIYSTVSETISIFDYNSDYQRCKSNAYDGMTDIDKDGCLDSADFCVFTDKEVPEGYKTLTGEAGLAAHGNNNCDRDQDGVPDICDKEPANPKIGCEKDTTSVSSSSVTRCKPTQKSDIPFNDPNCIGRIKANPKQ